MAIPMIDGPADEVGKLHFPKYFACGLICAVTIIPIITSVSREVMAQVPRDVCEAALGLKQDQVAYEAVADVIGALEPCCGRARALLNGLSDVLLSGASPMFADAPHAGKRVKIFQP